EQPVQGALGVAVVRPAHEVVGGQQDLAGADAVPGEGGGVPGDQQALADAGRRLLGGQVAGALGQAERGQPGRDRPRGDQDDLTAVLPAGGQRRGERADPHPVDLAVRRGQRRGADLDHDPCRGGDVGALGGRGVRDGHEDSRGSVPRGPCRPPGPDPRAPLAPLAPLAIGAAGSQSNTTASSGSPIRTSAPGSAPASARATSTPRRASRSARYPTASSLLKSVCWTQRRGFSPMMRKLSPSLTTSKPGSPAACTLTLTRLRSAGCSAGRAARSAATSAAMAKPSGRSPSPVAAEISKTW